MLITPLLAWYEISQFQRGPLLLGC